MWDRFLGLVLAVIQPAWQWCQQLLLPLSCSTASPLCCRPVTPDTVREAGLLLARRKGSLLAEGRVFLGGATHNTAASRCSKVLHQCVPWKIFKCRKARRLFLCYKTQKRSQTPRSSHESLYTRRFPSSSPTPWFTWERNFHVWSRREAALAGSHLLEMMVLIHLPGNLEKAFFCKGLSLLTIQRTTLALVNSPCSYPELAGWQYNSVY